MNGFQAAAVLAIFVLFAAIELKRGRFWAKYKKPLSCPLPSFKLTTNRQPI